MRKERRERSVPVRVVINGGDPKISQVPVSTQGGLELTSDNVVFVGGDIDTNRSCTVVEGSTYEELCILADALKRPRREFILEVIARASAPGRHSLCEASILEVLKGFVH